MSAEALIADLGTRRDEALARYSVLVAHPELSVYEIALQPIGNFGYDYYWDAAAWRGAVRCSAVDPAANFTDERVIHEMGHHLDKHLDLWRPGGSARAYREMAYWHGADPDVRLLAVQEVFAELFAASLIPNYVWQYPGIASPTLFHSTGDERAFFRTLREEAWAMARMAPIEVAVQLDASGNTTPNGVVVPVSGLRPGFPAQGLCSRSGFTGNEPTIGDALFATDTATQTFGKLHVRGAEPKGGIAYYTVSGFQ